MDEFIQAAAEEMASEHGPKSKNIASAFIGGAVFTLSFLREVMTNGMVDMYRGHDYRGMYAMYERYIVNTEKELCSPTFEPVKEPEVHDLFLILTAEWFKKHHTGGKKIEYRAITEYWRKRLYTADGTPKAFRTVTFQLGYAKNAPRITKSFEGLDAGFPVVQWVPEGCERKQYFRIHCGDIFAAVNC